MDNPVTRDEILAAIDAERDRQRSKWNDSGYTHEWGYGDCSSNMVPVIVKVAVLTEEVGEVARAVLDGGKFTGRADDTSPNAAASREQLRREVVQVAAVAIAILEGM